MAMVVKILKSGVKLLITYQFQYFQNMCVVVFDFMNEKELIYKIQLL